MVPSKITEKLLFFGKKRKILFFVFGKQKTKLPGIRIPFSKEGEMRK